MTYEIAPQQAHEAPAVITDLSVAQVKAHVEKVRAIMRDVMEEGIHYGSIPGIDKKMLFLPGAELLCVAFMMAPTYEVDIQRDGNHITVLTTCTLTHIPTGKVLATHMGLCSSRESRYAYRQGTRKCPKCGAAAIIKGKKEFGGGWLCWTKNKTTPGCGAKFSDDDKTITSQQVGRIENEDIIDQHNTVLKISLKRSLSGCSRNATGASDLFTEEYEGAGVSEEDAYSRPHPKAPPTGRHDAQDEAEQDIPMPPPKKTTPPDTALRKDAAGTHGPAPLSGSVALHNADDSPLEAGARDLLGKATTIEQLQAVWGGAKMKEIMSYAGDGEKVHITNMKNKRKRELVPDQP